MVCNNTKRDIVIFVIMILDIGNFRNLFHNILNSINLKKIINALHHAGKTLKSHTGVNIFLCKFCIVTVSVIIKLAENIVPDFSITVALTAGFAVRTAAAILFAAVKINLTARTAGTLSMLPEIVFLTKSYYM